MPKEIKKLERICSYEQMRSNSFIGVTAFFV